MTTAALTATLGLAAASWVAAVGQMSGMNMGPATRLGSPAFFMSIWVVMMAAMMLPSALVYTVYRPHGTLAAGAVTVAAGFYEVRPVKRRCRRYCQEGACPGLEFGLCCVGLSVGLMLMFLALA